MIIGNFTYDVSADVYVGDIVTFGFVIERATLVPNAKKGAKEPDYRLTAPTIMDRVELGAGWKRTSEKGQPFVSVTLDGPLLEKPLSAALFLDERDRASLVWNRAKAKASASARKAA